MRSSCGSPVIRPASSRTMVSSRTSARAMSRWSSGTSRPWMRNRCTSGAAGSRVSSNPENRHTPSRSATSGCQPRWVRSSTACPSGPPRKVNQSGQPPPSPSGLRTATATRSTAGGMRPSLPRIRSARASGAPLPSSSAVWEVTYRSTSTVRPAGMRLDQLGQVGRCRALRAGGHGRDDQVLVPVVGVLRGHQRAAAPLGDLDVPQRPDPVVTPRHHLEHDRVVPLGEDAEDRLARGDHGVDLGRPGRGVRREPVQLGAYLLLAPGPLGGDQRRVEAAVADLPGQVADAGVP